MTTTPAFNLELRQIKIAKFASQETYCYSAVLYLDGRKVATVENQGHGGCDLVRWLDRAAEVRVKNHFDALPTFKAHGYDLQPSLEIWCGDRLAEHDLAKTLARDFKRKVVGLREGKQLLFSIAPADLTANIRAVLEAKHPGLQILNGMDPLQAARLCLGR